MTEGTGYAQRDRLTLNSFIPKILTPKLFDIKILQTLFCRTRAQQDFRGCGGGGGTPALGARG